MKSLLSLFKVFKTLTIFWITGFSATSLKASRESVSAKGEHSELNQTVQLLENNAKLESVSDDVRLLGTVGENTEKPTSSSARPKGLA